MTDLNTAHTEAALLVSKAIRFQQTKATDAQKLKATRAAVAAISKFTGLVLANAVELQRKHVDKPDAGHGPAIDTDEALGRTPPRTSRPKRTRKKPGA